MKDTVIKCLDKYHGKDIIKYFKNIGVNTNSYKGTLTKKNNDNYIYYGIINNEFRNYDINMVVAANITPSLLSELLRKKTIKQKNTYSNLPENWMVRGENVYYCNENLRPNKNPNHWFNKVIGKQSLYGFYNNHNYTNTGVYIKNNSPTKYTLVTKEQLLNHFNINLKTKTNEHTETEQKNVIIDSKQSNLGKGRSCTSRITRQTTSGIRYSGNKTIGKHLQKKIISTKVCGHTISS